jgi:hypothetical protein
VPTSARSSYLSVAPHPWDDCRRGLPSTIRLRPLRQELLPPGHVPGPQVAFGAVGKRRMVGRVLVLLSRVRQGSHGRRDLGSRTARGIARSWVVVARNLGRPYDAPPRSGAATSACAGSLPCLILRPHAEQSSLPIASDISGSSALARCRPLGHPDSGSSRRDSRSPMSFFAVVQAGTTDCSLWLAWL